MRNIDTIVIHHSASDIPAHDNISVIREWHVQERGWSDVGYHFYIARSGLIQRGRPIDLKGAHVAGFNASSIGICLGGINDFTDHQFLSLAELIKGINTIFGEMIIYGHNDLDPINKPNCPGFDIEDFKNKHLWPSNS